MDGSGLPADPFTVTPVVDPAACNALTCGPGGLRVPEVLLQALASTAPGPVGADRSVNVDIAHPGGCPDRWQIGARLSPVSGAATLAADRFLHGNPGTWLNTGLVATLPEPGRYFVSWDVRAVICATASHCSNMWTEARAVNNATGALEAPPRGVTQHQFSTVGGSSLQTCQSSTAPITHIVGVPAAQGSKTLRLQGIFNNNSGCPATTVQHARIQGARTYVTWVKITD